jgi:hypothetical protein
MHVAMEEQFSNRQQGEFQGQIDSCKARSFQSFLAEVRGLMLKIPM